MELSPLEPTHGPKTTVPRHRPCGRTSGDAVRVKICLRFANCAANCVLPSAGSASTRIEMRPQTTRRKTLANLRRGEADATLWASCKSGRRDIRIGAAEGAVRFRNAHPPNRWWKAAPGGQPVPQLIEGLSASLGSNASIDCPSTPAAPWLAFTFLKASQTSRFEIANGFALFMRLLPSPVGRRPRPDTAAPSVQPHYKAFNPTTDSSAPVSCIGSLILAGSTNLDLSLGIKTTGSHVPCKSLSRSHAAFEPDVAWAGLQVSAQTPPEMTTDLGLDINAAFSTIHRRFAFARLSETYQSGIASRPFCNAHHHCS
jgi:hypothetical protein